MTLPPAGQGLPPNAHVSGDGAGPAQMIVTLRTARRARPVPVRGSLRRFGRSRGRPDRRRGHPSGGRQTTSGTVTVLGSGFTGVRRVTFGGVRAPASSSTVPTGSPSPTRGCQPPRRAPHSPTPACTGRELPQRHLPGAGPGVYARAASTRRRRSGRLWRAAQSERDGGAPHPRLHVRGGADRQRVRLPAAARIDSVSTAGGPATLASERGGSVITVTGAGLNPLDIDWATRQPRQ